MILGFFGTPWMRPWALASWSQYLDPRRGTWRRADRTQRTRSPRSRPHRSPRVELHREIEHFVSFPEISAKIIFRRNSLFSCKRKLKVLYVLPVHFTVLLILDIFFANFFVLFANMRKNSIKLFRVNPYSPWGFPWAPPCWAWSPWREGFRPDHQRRGTPAPESSYTDRSHCSVIVSLLRIYSCFCLPLPALLLLKTCVPHRPLFCCVSVDFFHLQKIFKK